MLGKIRPHIILQATAAFETGLLAVLKGSAKFIYRIENDWDVNGEFAKFKPWVSKVYELGLRKADAIIAQTEYQQKLLKNNYGLGSILIKNAQIIPSEPELVDFSDRKYFLWVGRLTKFKRPELFIELAKRNSKFEFVMVSSYDIKNEYVQSILSATETVPNLKMFVGLNWWDVIPLYKNAIALVTTSDPQGEGYPNVIVEAMKYGCPIYSLAWNRDNVIGGNLVGKVFHDNRELFFEGLTEFTENRETWVAYSKNAYKYAKDNHDLNAIADIYLSLFDQLL
jgi:glycosyltransferase involved in cell wall biosynthesis